MEREGLCGRLADLGRRSRDRGICTYSGFLYPYDAALAYTAADGAAVTLYGGFPEAERVMVRFGNEDCAGFDKPFPIRILQVSPLNERFSDDLTHRDFLGALMNLGIEREVTGDILLCGHTAYLCVQEQMSDFICRELVRVKHTAVQAVPVHDIPEEALPKKEILGVNAASERLDAVIAALYRLSRTGAKELFGAGKVFLNGRECLSENRILKAGDIVTVRGFGRFIYRGIDRETKKNRLILRIERQIPGN